MDSVDSRGPPPTVADHRRQQLAAALIARQEVDGEERRSACGRSKAKGCFSSLTAASPSASDRRSVSTASVLGGGERPCAGQWSERWSDGFAVVGQSLPNVNARGSRTLQERTLTIAARPFARRFARPSTPSIRPSAYPSVRSSAHPSARPRARPPARPPVRPPFYHRPTISPSCQAASRSIARGDH